jgi:hypothetical protein
MKIMYKLNKIFDFSVDYYLRMSNFEDDYQSLYRMNNE